MKKLSLFVLIAIASCASKAASVYDKDGTSFDIFGSIDATFLNDHASRSVSAFNGKKNDDNALLTRVKLGIAGRTNISDSLSAIGYSQWDMPTGNHGIDKIKARSQYVGIDAYQYGTLTFGCGDTAFYTVAGTTDVFYQLDQYVNDYYILGDEKPSLAMYSVSTLGWDVRLSVQTAVSDVDSKNVDIHNGAAFSVATRSQNGFGFSYGINYTDFQYENDLTKVSYFAPNINVMHNNSNTDDLLFAYMRRPSWKVDKGISLTYGNMHEGLYAALTGTVTKYDGFTNHLYSYEALLSYTLDNGLTLTSYYGIKRFNGANIISNAALSAGYQIAPSFRVYAEASFDINSKPERYYSKQQIINTALGENKALIGAQYSY